MAITKKEFQEYAATEEGKKEILAAAKNEGMVTKEELLKVNSKKEELLKEKKVVQEELKKAKEKVDDLESDLVGYSELKDKKTVSEKDADDNRKKQREIERNLKIANENLETSKKELDKVTKLWHDGEKGRALAYAMKENKIIPTDHDLITSAYRDRVSVSADEDGKVKTTIKDDNGIDQPVNDFFKLWSVTNKHRIIDEQLSTGGGSPGNGQNKKAPDNVGGDFFEDGDFKK